MRLVVTIGTEMLPVEVVERDGRYRVRVADEWLDVDARMPSSGPCSLLLGGVSYLVDISPGNGELLVTVAGETYRARVEEWGRRVRGRSAGVGAGAEQRLVAPMPGRVVSVHVRPGDRVERDAALVVLEAMKMENEFRAASGGVVTEVRVTAGQAVNAGDLLVVVRAEGG